jgi:NADPH:quinone reductase-like Zn-dependent oxidoreductase
VATEARDVAPAAEAGVGTEKTGLDGGRAEGAAPVERAALESAAEESLPQVATPSTLGEVAADQLVADEVVGALPEAPQPTLSDGQVAAREGVAAAREGVAADQLVAADQATDIDQAAAVATAPTTPDAGLGLESILVVIGAALAVAGAILLLLAWLARRSADPLLR